MKIKLVVAAVACLALSACNPSSSDKNDENKTATEQIQGTEGVRSETMQKIDQQANEIKQDVKNRTEDLHKKTDEAAQDAHRKVDEMKKDIMNDTTSQMPGASTTPESAPSVTPTPETPKPEQD